MNKIKNLVPYPQQVIEHAGSLVGRSKLIALISKETALDKAVIHKLKSMNIEFTVSERVAPFAMLLIRENNSSAVFPDVAEKVPQKSEGYYLTISENDVCLQGYDIEGLFWGLTTFEQLAENSDRDVLPACEITDWPEVESRGHFDDVSRKRISTTEDFKSIIRRLSKFKINYYGIYIEDVLHLKSYPDIGEKRGKLMPWDVQEIIAEAELYKVNVIPFFQLVGHCENLLDMPNYKHLGRRVIQKMSSLDADNPEVRVFLKNCIKDVVELFPCKYFGMGFDEIQGFSQKQFYAHANWCAQELGKYDKTPLLWADMMYNHFGFETLSQLDPSIIPVNWQYQAKDGEIPFWREFVETKRRTWGFGGYNNWCIYVPSFEMGKNNIEAWTKSINNGPGSGLFYSQWGDNGYENNRDLPWNLFAYAGECSWRGNIDKKSDFEDRFQNVLYGRVIPELTEVANAVGALNSQISFWDLHRKNSNAFYRIAANEPGLLPIAQKAHDEIAALLEKVKAVEVRTVPAEQTAYKIVHHYVTALTIMLLITKRFIFAFNNNETQELKRLIDDIDNARVLYMKDWLLNNRLEGLEVSQAVFTNVIASYQELLSRRVECRAGFETLDLSAFYNTYFEDIAGIPIGTSNCVGIPFSFASKELTHVSLKKGERVDIKGVQQNTCRNTGKVKDLHIIVSSPMTEAAIPVPAMKLSLLKAGVVVFEEVINSVTHCVDWFAPFGEHMWAGGGLQYADMSRVTPALSPDLFFGLMKISGFDLNDRSTEFDQIRIDGLAEKNVELFAITLECKVF